MPYSARATVSALSLSLSLFFSLPLSLSLSLPFRPSPLPSGLVPLLFTRLCVLTGLSFVRLRVDFISFHRSSAGGQYWPYSPNDDDDVPNGLAAISKVPAAGWGQILAYMAFCEVSQDQSPGTPAAAGDFGFKVLTSSDPAEKTNEVGLPPQRRPRIGPRCVVRYQGVPAAC